MEKMFLRGLHRLKKKKSMRSEIRHDLVPDPNAKSLSKCARRDSETVHEKPRGCRFAD